MVTELGSWLVLLRCRISSNQCRRQPLQGRVASPSQAHHSGHGSGFGAARVIWLTQLALSCLLRQTHYEEVNFKITLLVY